VETSDDYWSRPFPMRDLFDPQACAERRVRGWLHRYSELAEACYLGCTLDVSDDSGLSSGGVSGEAAYVELVCIKADLDKAIGALPTKWQIVILLCYREKVIQEQVGRMLRVNQSTISRILSRACIKMASALVILSDEGESAEGIASGI